MNLRQFWILIEPRSKILSILPTLMGILFAQVYFHQFNWKNSLIFFAGSLLFDATASSINNIMDYYKGTTPEYKRHSNLVGRNGMNPTVTAIVVVTMLVISTAIGIYLVTQTGWLLLLMGMFCFAVGIFYTFGPLPLSRLPLGEVFSGFTMGILIPIIAIFVNVKPESLMNIWFNGNHVYLSLELINFLATILVCILPTLTIAGVELANNLSDYEEDLINNRKTLAMYISASAGQNLYRFLMYGGYASTVVAVILKVLPWPTLIIFLTLPRVVKLVNIFLEKQHKQETFHTSLIISAYEMGAINLGLVISLFL